ncbi:MAG TPA: M50 family metallopeptidase [Candidatus Sulfotelmatobacter sp.]|nr:M50 family metallopeptidase [Candidatus Sulfotelmatobacter sp.]
MHTIRKSLCWVFAFTSLVCLNIVVTSIIHPLHRHTTHLLLRHILVTLQDLAFSLVFGVAWWTILRGKRTARLWGFGASLIYAYVACSNFYLAHSFDDQVGFVTSGIGVLGLVAFWRRYEVPSSSRHRLQALPGDGTNRFLNMGAPLLIFVMGVVAYSWWTRWVFAHNLPIANALWYRTLLLLIVLFVITTVHELGHAIVGLAFGMKLRGFLVGPFQWRIHDGKWEFKFKPAAILLIEGATGIVPGRADLPRRNYLRALFGGPCANIFTGLVALWMAAALRPDSPLESQGMLALFGVWSMVLGAVNLLPFRAMHNYSDGAKIYQILSDGPWGDYHRAISLIGSTLVTPLRPRDYDIHTIQRAAVGITQGKQALLLRLYASNYFLDHGKIPEAVQALEQAEAIFHESAGDIPVELYTAFVFGSAYLRRDASAAREWWTRLESKKPTRFNLDYWKARSALDWVEGNRKEANAAWEKANALAQQLPSAGAYEFDRYCCSLLQQKFI